MLNSTVLSPQTRVFVADLLGQIRDDNRLKMKLVWIPAGAFAMGSYDGDDNEYDDERPVSVSLTCAFWLGAYPVTQAEWRSVMRTAPWSGVESVREGEDFPATCVSWDEAAEFCQQFTTTERERQRLSAGWKYDLPTEAQWEYACRAGTPTRFSFGDQDCELLEYGWFVRNAYFADELYAHRVGQKKPNPWGLFDMHGNVWEWCRDWYRSDLPGGIDPEVSAEARSRVARGGCWDFPARFCCSADRGWFPPDYKFDHLGFRVAAVPSEK
jgi:formylglycine-generating enzyme